MVKIGIDLLWVRHKQVGGIETYIRNLLDGFCHLEEEYEFWLLVSRDNKKTFDHYVSNKRMKLHQCDIESKNVAKRIMWQNLFLGKTLRSLGLSICFEPYYCKPILGVGGISFVTTIHDLQALHYPEYFSKGKVFWMKLSWFSTVKTSKHIVAISDYVKNDICEYYKVPRHNISRIYNPVLLYKKEMGAMQDLSRKYNVADKRYYFTVSSLLPHKNIQTLVRVMSKIKTEKTSLPTKLIISGIGGKEKASIVNLIEEYDLSENIILTPFIDDAERDGLYNHCAAFLFPSLFEGFGMPPLEAIFLGAPVITTKKTCIPEVTMNKAVYIENPMDVNEWIETMKTKPAAVADFDFSVYDHKVIAKQYFLLFKDVCSIT